MSDFQLSRIKEIPNGFFELKPSEMDQIFQGPTLIELEGKKDPAIFISVLLHGNETTGMLALQELLRLYHGRQLPRSLKILVGNVKAARKAVRRLDGQEDFNRIWSPGSSPGQSFANQVYDIARTNGLFLNIDIHNNTGNSPHYSCVCRLDEEFINLARLFSDTIVYFKRPAEVQSTYFSQLCPSVTLETGKVGDLGSVDRTVNFLEICLSLEHLPRQRYHKNLKVYHSVAGILVPKGKSLNFSDEASDADLTLPAQFDHWNFVELPENTKWGERLGETELLVIDEKSNDVSSEFLKYEGGQIRLKRAVVPAMLTQDQRVIEQDCLGYFMQRYSLD